jgi:hypothetical protein
MLLVESCDFRPSSQYIVASHSQSLPFCQYVFEPDKSPVEVQPGIIAIPFLYKLYVVYSSTV